jgi:hypothetical protein
MAAPDVNTIQRKATIEEGMAEFAYVFRRELNKLAKDASDLMLEHVRTEYARPLTGKGFTDRTYDLRNSIQATVDFEPTETILRYTAGSAEPTADHPQGVTYAGYVEYIKNGEYAYLGPSFLDMAPVVEQMLRDRMNVLKLQTTVAGFKGRRRIIDLLELGREAEAVSGGSESAP